MYIQCLVRRRLHYMQLQYRVCRHSHYVQLEWRVGLCCLHLQLQSWFWRRLWIFSGVADMWDCHLVLSERLTWLSHLIDLIFTCSDYDVVLCAAMLSRLSLFAYPSSMSDTREKSVVLALKLTGPAHFRNTWFLTMVVLFLACTIWTFAVFPWTAFPWLFIIFCVTVTK